VIRLLTFVYSPNETSAPTDPRQALKLERLTRPLIRLQTLGGACLVEGSQAA
jgi:hypothetical protein